MFFGVPLQPEVVIDSRIWQWPGIDPEQILLGHGNCCECVDFALSGVK